MLKLIFYTIIFILSYSLGFAEDFDKYNKSENLQPTPSQAKAKNLESYGRSDNAVRSGSRSDDKVKKKERTSSRPTRRY